MLSTAASFGSETRSLRCLLHETFIEAARSSNILFKCHLGSLTNWCNSISLDFAKWTVVASNNGMRSGTLAAESKWAVASGAETTANYWRPIDLACETFEPASCISIPFYAKCQLMHDPTLSLICLLCIARVTFATISTSSSTVDTIIRSLAPPLPRPHADILPARDLETLVIFFGYAPGPPESLTSSDNEASRCLFPPVLQFADGSITRKQQPWHPRSR